MQANKQQPDVPSDHTTNGVVSVRTPLSTCLTEVFDAVGGQIGDACLPEQEPMRVDQFATVENSRWRDLASRQGYDAQKSYRLTGVAKVYAVNEDQSHLHLFVVAPYLSPVRDYYVGRIGFEISIAKDDIRSAQDHEGIAAGDLIIFFPDRLTNHSEPRPGFLTDALIVLSKGLRYNPFAYADTRSFVQVVTDQHGRIVIALGRLINLLSFFYEILEDRDQQLIFDLMIGLGHLNAFLTQPASTNDHHSYSYGLAVHTVETILQAVALNIKQPSLNLSSQRLLILMAWLHDIGKCSEYLCYGSNAFQLSESGILAGHVVIGGITFSDALTNQPSYCQLRMLKVLNCITAAPKGSSPHGARGRLSPEAEIVHRADCLSASGKLQSDVVMLMQSGNVISNGQSLPLLLDSTAPDNPLRCA